jgi:hypothetical protein
MNDPVTCDCENVVEVKVAIVAVFVVVVVVVVVDTLVAVVIPEIAHDAVENRPVGVEETEQETALPLNPLPENVTDVPLVPEDGSSVIAGLTFVGPLTNCAVAVSLAFAEA